MMLFSLCARGRWAGLAVAFVVGSAPWTTWAAPDCFGATDAVADKQWTEARRILEGLVAEPACAADRASLEYTLAYVLEQQAEGDATQACPAAYAYAKVIDAARDQQTIEAARQGAARMRRACQLATAPPEPPETQPEPSGGAGDGARTGGGDVDTGIAGAAAGPDRTTAWTFTAASAGALLAGGALLAVALDADADRAAAEDDMRARHAEGDAAGLAAAEARFVDAADQATLFGLSGYGALAIGAGLGIAAAWMWSDDGAHTVAVGPGQVVLMGRF